MGIVNSTEIDVRSDFSLLCNWRRLRWAAEIGVDRGEFAAEFLSRWTGCILYCIDPYLPYSEMPWEREGDYLAARARLSDPRARLIRQSSQEFCQSLDRGEGPCYPLLFDFVYLDGDHRYEKIKQDLELWWPRISHHGVLAGHDCDPDHPGVVRAVTEFAEQYQRDALLTRDSPYSWYIYKNPPGPDWKRIIW